MKNYNEIDGWFDYQKTYTYLVSKVPDNGIFVECGAWLGKSSSYLCDLAQDRIQVYIVDHWEGSPEERSNTHKLATEKDIYQIFLDNMGDRNFTPLKMDSINASQKFKDNSCDVVFIDMDHSYESVKQDIEIWLPKIKKYGYIAGHDYDNYWSGVIKAVHECFDINKLIVMDKCWIYKNE